MRPCEEEMLMAYADGELPAREWPVIQRRLSECQKSRQLVALYRRTAALARLAYDEPVWRNAPHHLVELLDLVGRRLGQRSIAVSSTLLQFLRLLLQMVAVSGCLIAIAIVFAVAMQAHGQPALRSLAIGLAPVVAPPVSPAIATPSMHATPLHFESLLQ